MNSNSSLDDTLVKKAYQFAKIAHQQQKRKFSEKPYFIHPEGVAKIVRKYTNQPEIIAAALLHDVIEDTKITFKQIQDEFGTRVAIMVQELTSNKPHRDKIGKVEYLSQKINNMSKDARLIKIADRLNNVADLENADNEFRERYAKQTQEIFDQIIVSLSASEQEMILKIKNIIKPFLP